MTQKKTYDLEYESNRYSAIAKLFRIVRGEISSGNIALHAISSAVEITGLNIIASLTSLGPLPESLSL